MKGSGEVTTSGMSVSIEVRSFVVFNVGVGVSSLLFGSPLLDTRMRYAVIMSINTIDAMIMIFVFIFIVYGFRTANAYMYDGNGYLPG